MKIKKETIAPIVIVLITAFLTVVQFTGDHPELHLALLCFLTAVGFMFERFKCVHLEHKLHKIEEAAKQ